MSVSPPQVPTEVTYAARVYDAYKIYPSGEGEIRALDGVSVGFEAGRFTAIMGSSGSGKSTLLQCVAGLESLTSGTVFIGDDPTSSLDATELTLLRRDRIGFVFQSYNLVPSLTARQNIVLPLKLAKRPVDEAWFETVVAAVGLRDRLRHRPAQLSGGQQQRVAVARALVSRPDLVLADEPTGNLDTASGAAILSFLRRAVDEWHQTVVMVTHDPSAAAIADLVLFLADGRIVAWQPEPTTQQIIEILKRLG